MFQLCIALQRHRVGSECAINLKAVWAGDDRVAAGHGVERGRIDALGGGCGRAACSAAYTSVASLLTPPASRDYSEKLKKETQISFI